MAWFRQEMRLSLTNSLSFEGVWLEGSDSSKSDELRTTVRYRLFNYKQLIEHRNGLLKTDDVASFIYEINHCQLGMNYLPVVHLSNDIKRVINNLDANTYNLLLDSMLKDSFLTPEEYKRLEYIIYYLNWKSDETTRRTSYNCDQCKKFNFIDGRYCYLEKDKFDIPVVKVIEKDGVKEIEDSDSREMTDEEFLSMVEELSVMNRELSIFEVSLKYFRNLLDENNKVMEICPEAFKINSENLAELFEMEARCSEYGVFPFAGGQLDQPALIIESFDAIRAGRNMFHSKKMDEVRRGSGRSEQPKTITKKQGVTPNR